MDDKLKKLALPFLCALVFVLNFLGCRTEDGAAVREISSVGKSIEEKSTLPDGIYGVSPEGLALKWTQDNVYSSVKVYSVESGLSKLISTSSQGMISVIKNRFYLFSLFGVDQSGVQSTASLKSYRVQSWNGFDRSSWGLRLKSEDVEKGSQYEVFWDYLPWETLLPWEGVVEGTLMRCYFASDGGSGASPFVSSAKTKEVPLSNRVMFVSSDELGLTGRIQIGCEVRFIDGYVSRHLRVFSQSFRPAMKPCVTAQNRNLKVFSRFECRIEDVLGTLGSSAQFELLADNSCSFLTVSSDRKLLSGSPDSIGTGTCNLSYRITEGGWVSQKLIAPITLLSSSTRWIKSPNDQLIQEVSRNDEGVGAGSGSNGEKLAPNYLSLLENQKYTVHVRDGDIETDKEATGRLRGKVLGNYRIVPSSDSCAQFGTIFNSASYLTSPTPENSGIKRATGEFYFQPTEHFYGKCTIVIVYEDVTDPSIRSDTVSLSIIVAGYNDPPVIVSGPVSSGGLYNCGSKCFVGIDYQFALAVSSGGKNPSAPSITGEPDQSVFVKSGNCIGSNEFIKVRSCEFNSETGKVVVDFKVLSLPTSPSSIDVRVSDNGDPRNAAILSSQYPQVTGTNRDCLKGGSSCQEFPNSNRDSRIYTINIDSKMFNLPIQPALIVRRAACISCHATINGDFVSSFGRSKQMPDQFFKEGWKSGEATDHHGWGDLDEVTGKVYVPKRSLTVAENPTFMDRVDYVNREGISFQKPLTAEVPLVDLLTASSWAYYNGSTKTTYNRSYVAQCLRVGQLIPGTPSNWDSCRPGLNLQPPDITDTLLSGEKIQHMIISYPAVGDIEKLAKSSLGAASKIIWTGTAADVKPVYFGQFDGLSVSTIQPEATLYTGESPKSVDLPYVRNVRGVPIHCYGDVVIKGDLLLDEPHFMTDAGGCTLYVSGNVVFHARNGQQGITVEDTSESSTNRGFVQVASDSFISFGLSANSCYRGSCRGHRGPIPSSALSFMDRIFIPKGNECYNASGAVIPGQPCPAGHITIDDYCDPPGSPRRYLNTNCGSSAFVSLNSFSTTSSVYNDHTDLPPGLDGWDWGMVDYERLMVNAPVIHGRYLGTFKGSIIADFALMRLGRLHFQFDPVFQGKVPFPRLQTIRSDSTGHPRVIFDAGEFLGDDSWKQDL